MFRWLFGGGDKAQPTRPDGTPVAPAKPEASALSSGVGVEVPPAGATPAQPATWDAASLERLAKAAKELQSRGHHVILVDYQPTSENMVVDFSQRIISRLPSGIQLFSLKLQETDSSFAEWFASDNL